MEDRVEQSLVVIKLYGEFSYHHDVERWVRCVMCDSGLVEGQDYDIVAGFVDDPRLLPESELASSKQTWFLGKCIQEAQNYGSEGIAVTLAITREEMKKPLTKQRASQLIDALKEQTAEAASLAALAKKSQS